MLQPYQQLKKFLDGERNEPAPTFNSDMKYKCKFIRPLGSGSFGAVFAVRTDADEQVAVKIINKNSFFYENSEMTTTLKNALKKERIILEEVRNSDMFTRLIHAEEGQHQCYFVMELVIGGSLTDFMRVYKISSNDVATFLLINLAKGLKFLHERGIIHRDIKPCNVLLRENAFPVIADFGLATHVQQMELLEMAPGTLQYQAPECFPPHTYNQKVDIFALAVTIWRLFFGCHPFAPVTNKELSANEMYRATIDNIRYKEVKRPNTCQNDNRLTNILMNMLSKSRSTRPLSSEIVEAFKNEPRKGIDVPQVLLAWSGSKQLVSTETDTVIKDLCSHNSRLTNFSFEQQVSVKTYNDALNSFKYLEKKERDLQQANVTLKHTIKDHEDCRKELREKYKQLKQKAEELKQQKTSIDEERKNLKDKSDKLKERKAFLEENLNKLKEKSKELCQQKTFLEESMKAITDVSNKLNDDKYLTTLKEQQLKEKSAQLKERENQLDRRASEQTRTAEKQKQDAMVQIRIIDEQVQKDKQEAAECVRITKEEALKEKEVVHQKHLDEMTAASAKLLQSTDIIEQQKLLIQQLQREITKHADLHEPIVDLQKAASPPVPVPVEPEVQPVETDETTFTNQSMMTAKTTKNFNCTSCDKSYASAGALYNHEQTKHIEKDLPKCTACGSVFTLLQSLKKHIKEGRCKEIKRQRMN